MTVIQDILLGASAAALVAMAIFMAKIAACIERLVDEVEKK
jgi:hypothetical protein